MKNKRWRDAITGEFMKEEDAEKRKDTTVAETIKPVKRKRKPKPTPEPNPSPVPITPVPEPDHGETPEERAFRMKMDVVYRGDIYYCNNDGKDKLPEESKYYLMDNGWTNGD